MRVLAACCLLVGLAACGPTSHSVRTGPELSPKAPDCEVQVFLSQRPDRKYEEVGQVEAAGHSSFAELIPLLRKEACKLGADAVIDVKQATGQGYSASGAVTQQGGTMTGSSYSTYNTAAVAVRFTDG